MSDDRLKILPPNGNYINGGIVAGQNTPGSQSVQSDMAKKGHNVQPPTSVGGQLTFGKDVLRYDLGGGLEIAVTPEVRLGLSNQSAEVKTGESRAWRVDVLDTYDYDNSYYGDDEYRRAPVSRPRTDVYVFPTQAEAEAFARSHVGGGRYLASYPQEIVRDEVDAASYQHGTIAPGLALGLVKDFGSGNYARADLWGAQNILGNRETTAGLRLSAGGQIGVYVEAERRMFGPGSGDIRAGAGLQLRLK